jgi:hypothetical protein
VFDALNLPAVINENAIQTLLLNQDRYDCQWQRLCTRLCQQETDLWVHAAVSNPIYVLTKSC